MPHRLKKCLYTLCFLSASCVVSSVALAQEKTTTEKTREAEMFGQSDETEDTVSENEDKVPKSKDTRDDKIFGDSTTTTTQTPSKLKLLDAQLERAEDRLALGGFLFWRGQYSIRESGSLEDNRLNLPQLVDLYLDARPNDRVRAYLRGRLLYNPSTIEQAQTDTADPTALIGGNASKLDVALDQLWLKFDVARTVYVTLGRQRIKWGAGRFWNPTDFLNSAQLDPLALFDIRLGVDLIKLHLPLETLGWNFYAIGLLGDTQSLKDVGGALRGEFVFGANEVSVSFMVRRQTFQGPAALPPVYEPQSDWPATTVPLRFGADYSGAVGPFDLKMEGALTKNLAQPFYRGTLNVEDLGSLSFPEDYRRDGWIFQGVIGAELSLKYSDEDSILIGAEYFYNQAGYKDADLYLWLLLQGGFRPLYLGRHYGALGLILPSPGSWNDSSFSLSALGNFSDRSFLARFDYRLSILTDLSFGLSATKYFGQYGEFRFKVDVPAVAGNPAVSVPAPNIDLAASLQMNF